MRAQAGSCHHHRGQDNASSGPGALGQRVPRRNKKSSTLAASASVAGWICAALRANEL
jgi:hypothetical protein